MNLGRITLSEGVLPFDCATASCQTCWLSSKWLPDRRDMEDFENRKNPGVPPLIRALSRAACRSQIILRPLGRLRLVDSLDAVKNLAEIALCNLNIIVGLQIEPKLRRCAERLPKPQRSIGRDASLFAGNPLNPRPRQAADLGESARRHFGRHEELLSQNFTGMHRLELLGHSGVPSNGSLRIRPAPGPPRSKQSIPGIGH